MKIVYPWDRLKRGEGFFVPAIDTEKARELGLRAAVGQRLRIKALPCIKDGLIGVWFYLPLPRPGVGRPETAPPPSVSLPPDGQSADAFPEH